MTRDGGLLSLWAILIDGYCSWESYGLYEGVQYCHLGPKWQSITWTSPPPPSPRAGSTPRTPPPGPADAILPHAHDCTPVDCCPGPAGLEETEVKRIWPALSLPLLSQIPVRRIWPSQVACGMDTAQHCAISV